MLFESLWGDDMSEDRDFLADLKGYEPYKMEFKFKDRLLKEDEKQKMITRLANDIRNARTTNQVFDYVQQALELVAKGAFKALL